MINITISYQSPEDAWLTGLTTAVSSVIVNNKPLTVEEFKEHYTTNWQDEIDLKVNLGRDEEYGVWHIVGYRMGLYLVLLTEWDIQQMNDDNAIAELWASVMEDDAEYVAATVAERLEDELGLTIVMLGEKESTFLKRFIATSIKTK